MFLWAGWWENPDQLTGFSQENKMQGPLPRARVLWLKHERSVPVEEGHQRKPLGKSRQEGWPVGAGVHLKWALWTSGSSHFLRELPAPSSRSWEGRLGAWGRWQSRAGWYGVCILLGGESSAWWGGQHGNSWSESRVGGVDKAKPAQMFMWG